MAISLSSIITGPSKDPLSIFLYGISGWGKTSWFDSCPNPIGIPTEDGAGVLSYSRFPVATNYDDVIGAIKELIEQDHDYKTVCIDTVDRLEPLIYKKVVDNYNENNRKQIKSHADIGHGQGWSQGVELLHVILKGLEILRTKKQMMVVLLAQSLIKKIELPDQEPYDKYDTALNDKMSLAYRSWAQIVMFGSYKIRLLESEKTKKIKAYGEGERVLYTEERPHYWGKHRHGLPQEIIVPRTGQWESFKSYLNTNKTGE